MNFRCHIGIHDHRVYETTTRLGWGLFGGPMMFWRWECRRCGKRGTTVG